MVTERKAHLNRFYSDEKQTLGSFSTMDGTELWVCKSLELPWDANIAQVSCIPPDTYLVQYTRSNRLSKIGLGKWIKANPGLSPLDAPDEARNVYSYEIMNVPNRAGIRIDKANYFYSLRGCLALGSAHKDINLDSNLDVIHSGNTVAKLIEIMQKQDFTLIID